MILRAASLAVALALPIGTASASELALKRVMLSTGGVAYLEHEAEVTGDAELTLDVPLDEVDDVLKSIVVYDSKGGVGIASLPGREPLTAVFGDLPFGEDALESPASLLNALQGAEIRIGASHPITGRLLKVVPETVKSGEPAVTTKNRVSLLTSDGLQQFILEDADAVGFVDPELQGKVGKALAAIAQHRAKDRRQIVLTTRGAGARKVRVGYVVAAPLWKATYRLTLPGDEAAKQAQLQGWAVLENMTGQDWNGIELTLLSGNPVSFRQAIYEAYYVTRPEVPVEVAGRILPKPDTGVLVDQVQREAAEMSAPKTAAKAGGLAAPPPVAAPAPGQGVLRGAMADSVLRSRSVDTAEAEEGLTQAAFRLPAPVTLAAGRSALVPITDREVPIERLSLYQPGTSASHPLASVKLKNDSPSALPPGVLTLYEQAEAGTATYVGDARLAGLPAGEDRLLSYAVDEKTKIEVERQPSSSLAKVAASQGVMTLTRLDRQTVLFRLVAPATSPRRLLIEQPKSPGWRLVQPAESAVEQTAGAYRLPVELKPGEKSTVTMISEAPRLETVRIADYDDARLGALTATRELDPNAKNALVELARLRRVLAEKRSAEQQIKDETQGLVSDQSRIRDNLASVDKDSALHKRYIEKLAQQESRIEALQASAQKAADDTHAAAAAVDAYVAKLTL